MAGHMLVLAPAAIFIAALAIAFDLPRRLKIAILRHLPRAFVSAHS